MKYDHDDFQLIKENIGVIIKRLSLTKFECINPSCSAK